MAASLSRSNRKTLLITAAVAAIALAAAAIRLVDLSGHPGGLFPDEAAEGNTAHQLLHNSGYNAFFDNADGGRETLFAYFVAFMFRLFGESVVTIRATSAVFGVLAVLAIGLALRRFGTKTALFAMLWAAGSLWLVTVSRDGMRNIICVTAGALIVTAILNWYDRMTQRSALLAGAFLGLGLWTYQPLKFTPLLVVLWIAWMRRTDRDKADRMQAQWRPLLIAFLVVAAPMLWTAISDATGYFGRGAATSLFNGANLEHEPYLTHVLRTLGQFLFVGDPNARHNVNGLPLLGPVLFVLAAIGFWVAWRQRKDGGYSLLLLGLPVFLIPPLIANESGSPHFLRNLGLAPYVAAYVGLGASWLVSRTKAWAGAGSAQLAAAGITFCMALIAIAGVNAYMARPVADLYDPYSYDLVAIANAAHGGPGDVVIADHYTAMDIEFLDDDNLPTIISPGERIGRPAAYSLIVALNKSDLARAVGSDIASRAQVLATNPQGQPTVYGVVP